MNTARYRFSVHIYRQNYSQNTLWNTSLQLFDIFETWQNIVFNYFDQGAWFFCSFEFFYETAEYYAVLDLLPDTKTGFLCACRLVAGKGSVTVWEQRHGAVSYAFQVYQALNALTAPYAVVFQWPECLAFIVWYFYIPARRITGKRQELFLFSSISTYGIIFTSAVV